MDRLKHINEVRQLHNLDAILISNPMNVYYLSGINSSNAYILVCENDLFYLTDGRYFESAKQSISNSFNVQLIDSNGLVNNLMTLFNSRTDMQVGFEGSTMSFDQFQILDQIENVEFVSINIDGIRVKKDETEISKIKQAVRIADESFEALIKHLKPGMTEREVEVFLLNEILKRNGSGFSFTSIVASGKRGALPHGSATDKVIDSTDFVTIDFGVVYDHYVSDITRSVAMSKNVNPQLIEIFKIVKEAHDLAILAIKPGVKCSQLDKIARDHIVKMGYGEYFIHGLGHSFGLQVHEQPFINGKNETILEANMLLTVEPGIYIPDLGGIRIESDILVTEIGYEKLSQSRQDLIYIQEEK